MVAQINGRETKYFFNESNIVLTFADIDHDLELVFWNEIGGTVNISFSTYGLATLGNLILILPGFWIGNLFALSFWYISKNISRGKNNLYHI